MKNREHTENGFTIIELLVGIIVGAIVLTMAISVIVSTNRTSIQLMSRQEVAQSTRVAVTQVLKDIGSAQSTLDCLKWNTSSLQASHRQYKDQLSAWDGEGSFPGTMPAFNGEDCNEYFETGYVLIFAADNGVCWNKNLTDKDGRIPFDATPIVSCMIKTEYVDPVNPPASPSTVPLAPCQNIALNNSEPLVLYYYECEANNVNYFASPDHFKAANYTYKDDSKRQIFSFAPNDDDARSFAGENLNTSVFTYEKIDGSSINTSDGRDTDKVEAVYVTLDIVYKSAKGSGVADTDFNIYRFSQKIMLQGARSFSEQGAYGGGNYGD